MRRRDFVAKSLMATGGLSVLSAITFSREDFRNGLMELRCNHHIRHGYYGRDCIVNKVELPMLQQVRLDLFENEDGNMLLYEFLCGEEVIHLGCLEKSIFVRSTKSDFEIKDSDLGNVLRTIVPGRLRIGTFDDVDPFTNKGIALIVPKINSGKSFLAYASEIDSLESEGRFVLFFDYA